MKSWSLDKEYEDFKKREWEEYNWSKTKPDFSDEPYRDEAHPRRKIKRPYWISIAWSVKCPNCGTRRPLMMKTGGRKLFYGFHSFPDQSYMVNPMCFSLNYVSCPMAGKEFKGDLPCSNAEGLLKGFVIGQLIQMIHEKRLTEKDLFSLVKMLRDLDE